MTATLPEIDGFLQGTGLAYEIWPCDPQLADTAAFCEHYDVALKNSANAILVRSKTGSEKYALCVLLATHRLNTNHTVRKKPGNLCFVQTESEVPWARARFPSPRPS